MKEKASIQTQSHGEKEIYEACLDLMSDMIDEFRDYLDFLDIDVSSLPEEEQFCLNIPPTEIVQKLFLSHTDHGGGTSTRAKCNELGIDTDEWVQFTFPEYKNIQEAKKAALMNLIGKKQEKSVTAEQENPSKDTNVAENDIEEELE